ncbi:hypothetical protein [Saccharicrinis aurantiacus]|uniref:hypothetical protein n=1 Tax=Saccharicrinis aurantiacus TaxID=1849719 RepID=UPI00083878EE|nr:hypothetical protein [Saccharicrinis aurantiacus]
MLEHQKSVLLGVAKYPELFKKELEKSLGWLNDSEATTLYKWLSEEFDQTIFSISQDVFGAKTSLKLS